MKKRAFFLPLLLFNAAPVLAAAPEKASLCIAPFHMSPEELALHQPSMSQTTWSPTESSHFEFRIDGKLRATVGNGEMAYISGLPADRRFRVAIKLDGRPFETLSLDLRKKPEHRLCLWLYPGYWHWIDQGWNEHLGCRCTSATPDSNTPSSRSIQKDQAIEIARKALLASGAEYDFVIQEEKTEERSFGWVFSYVPRRYLLTRDPDDLVPGNGPLVVYRKDGRTEFLPTSVPPEVAIEELERRSRP